MSMRKPGTTPRQKKKNAFAYTPNYQPLNRKIRIGRENIFKKSSRKFCQYGKKSYLCIRKTEKRSSRS